MQQSYAKVSGVFENLPPHRLVEDAIAMNIGAFERHGVDSRARILTGSARASRSAQSVANSHQSHSQREVCAR